MKLSCSMSHKALEILWSRRRRRFRESLSYVAEVQERYLLGLLRESSDTEFGRAHRFSSIRSVRDYQERVPVGDSESFRPAIDRIRAGQPNVLTSDPVLRLEPTSGSAGPVKLIPWTRRLQAEFLDGIAPWLLDLLQCFPGLRHGSAYWTITPVGDARMASTAGTAVPIGFGDDLEYLGSLAGRLLGQVLMMPPAVTMIPTGEVFRYVTLLFLLADADLRLISLWSPSFLQLVLDELEPNAERLVHDLGAGEISSPAPLDPRLRSTLRRHLRASPRRSAKVRQILQAHAGGELDHPWESLWPRLALISCWTDGWASLAAERLRERFPRTPLQGKGLLATEAVVSIPWTDGRHRTGPADPVLCVPSHFFEFEAPRTKAIHLAHQLREGEKYDVVITTGGGLYRYRLEDRIVVTGRCGQAPRLRFLRRSGRVSDLTGEKLSDHHVARAVGEALREARVESRFHFVAPETEAGSPHYVLFVRTDGGAIDTDSVARAIERRLRENPHYSYCRDLGQLAPLTVKMVTRDAERVYLSHKARRSHASTVKSMVLEREPGWASLLRISDKGESSCSSRTRGPRESS